jgi:membrane-associated protease RseP (regulator of RpoE activity)
VGVGLVPAFLPIGPTPPELSETDASGSFSLDRLATGRVTLSAYSVDHGRAQLEVQVQAGQPLDDLVLRLAGASARDVDQGLANLAITLGTEAGDAGAGRVVVAQVPEGGEAARAGTRAGDVLESVDGVVVVDMAQARRLLGGADGSDLVLGLSRDGRPLSVRARRERVRR